MTLEADDVANAIIEEVTRCSISKLVIGVSSHGFFSRYLIPFSLFLLNYLKCEIPRRLGRRMKHFYKGWKPLSSRRVLKILRGSLKGKSQKGQYLLAVDLGCYK